MKVKGLVYLVLIAMICLSLYTGSRLYESDMEQGIERDIYNYTNTYFSWNESIFDTSGYEDNTTTSRVNNIMFKLSDSFGYMMFESTKMFVEIGYESQGKYNLGFMLKFIQIVLWVIIIGIIFYPALVIGVLLYELFKYVKRKLNHKTESEAVSHE